MRSWADSAESNLNCVVRIQRDAPGPRFARHRRAGRAPSPPDGLHGTPIDRVVAAAGVAKPTLYARGGDKEELFALAVEAEVERLLERFEGGVGQIAARRWTSTSRRPVPGCCSPAPGWDRRIGRCGGSRSR